MQKALLFILLLVSLSANAWAQEALVVFDNGDPDHTNARDGLVPKLTAAGQNVTQDGTGSLPADLSPYNQLWDLRADIAISGPEQAQIVAFLNAGNRAFIMGENTGYGITRNPTIASLVTALGAGTIVVGSPNTQTQTINSPWDVTANLITYPAAGGVAAPGTGVFITDDGTGAGNPGSAIAFDPGTMTNAPTGSLAIVFDVNFLQTAFFGNPTYPGCEDLADSLISYVGGTLTPASIPTLSEWGMIIMSILLGITAVIYIRRQRMEL
jgi:hypothetical protein